MLADVRADRLVAILLLLQARGQVTAGEVAEELEVSERTARRPRGPRHGRLADLLHPGPGRGVAPGGRRQDRPERAHRVRGTRLFLVAGPASTTPEVKAALRKLVRALPEPFRDDAQAASAAVVVDPETWDRRRVGPLPRLCSTRCRRPW